MLHVRGLVKAYGRHLVLDGVDLDVAPGEVLGLVGANGAGKTTLISVVAGLRRADAGSVTIAGLDAFTRRAQANRHLGLAPQELGIYPTLTARANLRTFAELAGLSARDAKRRAEEVAELLGLTDQLDQKAETLSGGQKRRLHTGMAVVHRPDLLFLDEPTVGSDVESRAGILALVRAMADAGTAVVYTTHYLTELEQLGADVAVLDGGRVLLTAPVGEVVERYGTTTVRLTFGGSAPALDGWTAEGAELVRSGRDLDAGTAAASALAALGPEVSRLVGLEVSPSSLESAYLSLTGRHGRIGDDTPGTTSPTPATDEAGHDLDTRQETLDVVHA
jgi:ABC-2 type transport system ATP-binding protein